MAMPTKLGPSFSTSSCVAAFSPALVACTSPEDTALTDTSTRNEYTGICSKARPVAYRTLLHIELLAVHHRFVAPKLQLRLRRDVQRAAVDVQRALVPVGDLVDRSAEVARERSTVVRKNREGVHVAATCRAARNARATIDAVDRLLGVRDRERRHVFGEGRENDAESGREIRVFARERGGEHRTLLGDRRDGRAEEEGRAVRALDHLERRLRKRETEIVAIRWEGHGTLEIRGRVRNGGRIDTLIRRNHCWWLRRMMNILSCCTGS